MVDQVKKKGIIVKGNNVSKSTRHCSYDLHIEIVMLKHTEQITVKKHKFVFKFVI
jgi:hypothetical protein